MNTAQVEQKKLDILIKNGEGRLFTLFERAAIFKSMDEFAEWQSQQPTVSGIDDTRPKPDNCYAKEQGDEQHCVFPACHCGLPQQQPTVSGNLSQADKGYFDKAEFEQPAVTGGKFTTGVEKTLEGWAAWFAVGAQTIYCLDRETEESAKWYERCLKTALTNISQPTLTDEQIEQMAEKEFPEIKLEPVEAGDTTIDFNAFAKSLVEVRRNCFIKGAKAILNLK